MASIDENLNLGNINQALPELIRKQFEILYNEIEERWNELAAEVNSKPDVVFNRSNAAGRSPPGTSLTQYKTGTIYVDLFTSPATVWILVEKVQVNVPPPEIQSVWIQLG